jgi:DnaJ-class molecular chaperone
MDKKESLNTLGLENSATYDEIKKKFRKLAKKSHPDLNKDKVKSTDDFIKLKKAYDTLLDDNKSDKTRKVSRVYVRYNNFSAVVDDFVDEITNFFKPRKNQIFEPDISIPEPFIDLRRIVRERKRDKYFKDF